MNPNLGKTRYFKNCMAVFQGGGVKALSFVGAYDEAFNRGVFFSEVAGTSAGSIIAALIAAGASPKDLEEIIRSTDFSRFEEPPDNALSRYGSKRARMVNPIAFGKLASVTTFLAKLGIYSSSAIEEWLDGQLKTLLGIDHSQPVTFADLILPLHVMATDIRSRRPKVWNSVENPTEGVAYAVRCSSTIPMIFQPVDRRYVDGGLLSNLPAFTLPTDDNLNYERILCFSLHPKREDGNFGFKTYSESLIDSVVEGAVDIQVALQRNLHQICIDDVGLGTTDFKKITDSSISAALNAGTRAARQFFDNEVAVIKRTDSHRNLTKTEPQTLNQIVLANLDTVSEVFILNRNCRIVYKLFPTFLAWSKKSIKVNFITLAVNEDTSDSESHENFRRFLLQHLGVSVVIVSDLPYEGAIFTSDDRRENMALVNSREKNSQNIVGHSTKYSGVSDIAAIEALTQRLDFLNRIDELKPRISRKGLGIRSGEESDVLKLIKNVSQYKSNNVQLSFQTIDIHKIVFLTRFVKSYKYNQIERIFDLYDNTKSELFGCLKIDYEGVEMFVTPPVVEKHGDSYYLIEGNSRLTYCIKELKLTTVKLVVVEGVSRALPSTGRYPISNVIISDTNKIGVNRYEKFVFEDYRWIEKAVRNPDYFLA